METFLWSENSKSRNKLTSKYEPIQPYLFLSFLEFSNAECVIDVGANIGFYSLVATLCENVSEVFAFEPNVQAFEELITNIELNSLHDKIKPSQLALSNKSGVANFGVHAPMAGVNGIIESSIHETSIFADVTEVSTSTLDTFTSLNNKVLGLKLDVEGHEAQVLEGAQLLLKRTPAVIQVEQFEGSQVPQLLKSLGYFSFFSAGHDFYYSNISNFLNPTFLNRAIKYASSWLVETSSGRLPTVDTIKFSLSVSATPSDGKIEVLVTSKEAFFFEPEYACYLIRNGEKIDSIWYQQSGKFTFNNVSETEDLEVKGFVREKTNHLKKVSKSSFINKKAKGFRADSMVKNAYGAPDVFATDSCAPSSIEEISYDIDISPIVVDCKKEKIAQLLLFGCSKFVDRVLTQLSKFEINAIVVVIPENDTIKTIKPDIQKICVSCSTYLEKTSHLCISDSERSLVVIDSYFFRKINSNPSIIENVLSKVGKETTVYLESLTDSAYRSKITDYISSRGGLVRILPPLSLLISSDEDIFSELKSGSTNSAVTSSALSKLDFSIDGYQR